MGLRTALGVHLLEVASIVVKAHGGVTKYILLLDQIVWVVDRDATAAFFVIVQLLGHDQVNSALGGGVPVGATTTEFSLGLVEEVWLFLLIDDTYGPSFETNLRLGVNVAFSTTRLTTRRAASAVREPLPTRQSVHLNVVRPFAWSNSLTRL